MGHWARRVHFLNFQRDGVRFIYTHPDRQDGLALHVLEHDNGHVGHGVHHQAADFHFHFHGGLPWVKPCARPPDCSASLLSHALERRFPEVVRLGKRNLPGGTNLYIRTTGFRAAICRSPALPASRRSFWRCALSRFRAACLGGRRAAGSSLPPVSRLPFSRSAYWGAAST